MTFPLSATLLAILRKVALKGSKIQRGFATGTVSSDGRGGDPAHPCYQRLHDGLLAQEALFLAQGMTGAHLFPAAAKRLRDGDYLFLVL